MPTVAIRLDISSDQFLAWYRGAARKVIARTREGSTIEFPASILQRFVTHDGVRGEFLLTFDEQNRFQRIERTGPESRDGLDQLG